MIKKTEIICDCNGIEIVVNYSYEQSRSQVEECHGRQEVGLMVYTKLTSVEVMIDGTHINILPYMKEGQKKAIIKLLSYE